MIRDYVSAYQKSGDTFDNIKGYIVWADNNEKVTTDEAKYATFSKLSKTEADKLSSELEKADASDDAYVKKIGRKFLIFPNYRIALKPLNLTIKTNVNKVDVLLNKRKLQSVIQMTIKSILSVYLLQIIPQVFQVNTMASQLNLAKPMMARILC